MAEKGILPLLRRNPHRWTWRLLNEAHEKTESIKTVDEVSKKKRERREFLSSSEFLLLLPGRRAWEL